MSKALHRFAEALSRSVGLRASQLFPSPSKFFLLRKMLSCLDQSAGMSIGLDAACADFKYRDMFKTDRYVGVDLDPDNLNKGIALRARSDDLAVLTDLLKLEQTPMVADVVVSTHTLSGLPDALRIQGVFALAGAVSVNGTLFFNIPAESDSTDLHAWLRTQFGVVERIQYANSVFMRIEDFFAYRTGSKNPFVLALLGGAIVLSYLLSHIEGVAWMGSSGAYVLYWCRNRKDGSMQVDERLQKLSRLNSAPLGD